MRIHGNMFDNPLLSVWGAAAAGRCADRCSGLVWDHDGTMNRAGECEYIPQRCPAGCDPRAGGCLQNASPLLEPSHRITRSNSTTETYRSIGRLPRESPRRQETYRVDQRYRHGWSPRRQDLCPGTPKGTTVDAGGCPQCQIDTDGTYKYTKGKVGHFSYPEGWGPNKAPVIIPGKNGGVQGAASSHELHIRCDRLLLISKHSCRLQLLIHGAEPVPGQSRSISAGARRRAFNTAQQEELATAKCVSNPFLKTVGKVDMATFNCKCGCKDGACVEEKTMTRTARQTVSTLMMTTTGYRIPSTTANSTPIQANQTSTTIGSEMLAIAMT